MSKVKNSKTYAKKFKIFLLIIFFLVTFISGSVLLDLSGEKIGKIALEKDLQTVAARVKGPGYGKAASLRGLKMAGVKIIQIQDVSPLPFNGCRPKKKRRV